MVLQHFAEALDVGLTATCLWGGRRVGGEIPALFFFAKKIAGSSLLGEEMEVCLATDLLIQALEKVERKGGTSVFIDLILSFFSSFMSQYV